MTDILKILDNCTIVNNTIKLPTTIGVEKRIFIRIKYEFSLVGGDWIGGDTFGFEFPSTADLTDILNSLKTKSKND